MTITIESSVFGSGQSIPTRYTGEGEDGSPPLTWTGVPQSTQELALICDDPDAPTPQPWVHWVICKIPASATDLPEDVEKVSKPDTPCGAVQGINSWERVGYGGPMPPPGHGVHHYHFTLYALDTQLEATTGLDKEALLKAMSGHIIAQGKLTGLYQR